MAIPSTRAGVDERATNAPVAEVAAALRQVLGDEVTILVAGVGNPSVVDRWVRGAGHPDLEAERRMRNALRVVDFLLQQEHPDTIRAWFVGLNPDLDDRVPARVIADEPDEVILAAGTFMAHS